MNQDGKMDTEAGAQSSANLTTEQKLENLAKNVFFMMDKLQELNIVVDNVYVQVATLIEVLAMNKDILNPEIWEEKLKEVTQNIKDTMEAMANEEGNSGQDSGKNPGGPDASEGNSKIIVPDNRIIIPGQ